MLCTVGYLVLGGLYGVRARNSSASSRRGARRGNVGSDVLGSLVDIEARHDLVRSGLIWYGYGVLLALRGVV